MMLKSRACHWKKAVGEPYEGKPHVRFDEGLVETQFGWAPLVYSTVNEVVIRKIYFLRILCLS